ncbi:Rv0361 family membrane protein [Phytomonospora endophytica]|uniref:Uncharacterized protein n=1 Tax=Phytomonospora endophytica TaxID=714109 RepID=A0A841FNJ3_9ACTN|nr:hypothetical protein [Phytomonospora endophytica]MBB6035368.1 hypothetical protein [Phytomonospora endophytica]GIG63880.1 hypothetical protein Pen01_01750 [Phytomonospora endophytica]
MTHETAGVDTEPSPQQAPPEDPPARKPRGGAFALLAALLAFCALAAVGGYLLIDNLADQGPADPNQAVEGFLGALLTDRDPQAARRYVCADIRDSDFAVYLDAVTTAEKTTGDQVQLAWDHVTTSSETGRAATVTADVSSTTSAGTEAETWTFSVVKAQDWYVCGLTTPA